MRVLWTMVKIIFALAFALPLAIIALALMLGIFGALLGLAILALKVAVAAVILVFLFRMAVGFFGGGSTRPEPMVQRVLPPVDPHYEAAMRELDRDLGETSR
jgi:hypothetical protein